MLLDTLKSWSLALVGAALLAIPAAAGEIWTENAKDALDQAAKEKKDILVDFTGSDWCGWCIKLDKEVFSQDAFINEAPKSFVFLKLDFPRQKQLSADMKKQNGEWQSKYGISGFPTILLLDSEGKAYAKTGYRQGGPEVYLKHLAELKGLREKRDAAFAKAAKAEGVEKAKLLDEALSAMGKEIAASYTDVVAEIVKLDADGKAGLKGKYESWALLKKVETLLQANKLDDALPAIDEALKSSGETGETAQQLFFYRGIVFFQKNDKENAKKALESAVKAAPETRIATQCKMIIEQRLK